MAPENTSATWGVSPSSDAPAAPRHPFATQGVHALVKWESPAEEVRGIAAGAAVLLRDRAVLPHQIGFAVPNRTWAGQLAQACKAMGVRASIAEAGEAPSGSTAVIFDFRAPARNVEWLFVVGCTEGLMPTAAATGDDETSRAAQQEQRAAFARLVAGDRPHVVLSYFAQADVALADQIRLPYRRTITRGGTTLACLTPTRFIGEMGAARPTTVGSQRFLRDAGLN